MKEALVLLLCVLLAFPFGVGFERFLRWVIRQRPDTRSKKSTANIWVYGITMGVGFNLAMAILRGFRHDGDGVQTHLAVAAIFTSLSFGAWAETRRFSRRSK